jgi:hypothetical protein
MRNGGDSTADDGSANPSKGDRASTAPLKEQKRQADHTQKAGRSIVPPRFFLLAG